MCVLLLVIFFFCFSLLEFAVCFYFFWKLRMPSLIFCFVFSHFFLDLFHHSNKVTEIVWFCLRVSFSFVCFYCLKSGKCIIISVCLFSKSRSFSFPPTCQICLLALSLSRSKLDTQKWIFFFFRVQIRLDSFFKNSESSCEKVVVVFFVCSSSR